MNTAIKSLGYLGLNVTDAESWNVLLQGVFALELRDQEPGGPQHYKMDRQHHRISVYPNASDDIAHIGWEVVDQDSLKTISETLAASSISVTAFTPEDCTERSVLGGAFFHDPVMKIRNELFYGATIESSQFNPSRAMQGYVTGDQGMGHLVLMTTRQQEAVDFYCDVLGFRVSDVMDFGGEKWGGKYRHVFLHCNSRHHSLAIMSPPAGGSDGSLNHFALTVRDFDDVGYAYDIVREKQIPVLMTLGKHVNDLATSFYVGNPSQSAIEMTYGGIEVQDDWTVKHYDDTKIWGHHTYLPPRPLN